MNANAIFSFDENYLWEGVRGFKQIITTFKEINIKTL
jgi:hypothetical protein